MQNQWIKVEDQLPELNLPTTYYDDELQKRVPFIENSHAIILGYNEHLGIFKAKFENNNRWSEISSSSIKGLLQADLPTHWMRLPQPPK